MAKSKQEKHYASEINNARNKLDGVLQTLMIKSEDSQELSENESVKTSPDANVGHDASNSCQKKPSAVKPPRKRRRKDDSNLNNSASYHHSYVMKLYDRSVDLAMFGEDSPLYPICRSWMHNQPQKANKARSRSPSPEPETPVATTTATADDGHDESLSQDVTSLPPTLPMNEEMQKKIMQMRSMYPTKIKQEFNTLPQQVAESHQSREELLAGHMTRWKEIRQRWKVAAFLYEAHYKESLSLIKSLFER